MRIQDLPGWPPKKFQTADAPPRPFRPVMPERLRIHSATFIQGRRETRTAGDLVLLLEARLVEVYCSTRLKIANGDVGLRAEAMLARCKGMTLAEAGNLEIRELQRL